MDQMDNSQQMPPAPPGLNNTRWLQPHSEAQIHVGPDFQASIPELQKVPSPSAPPAGTGGEAPQQRASNGGVQFGLGLQLKEAKGRLKLVGPVAEYSSCTVWE
eukprot:g13330.t1